MDTQRLQQTPLVNIAQHCTGDDTQFVLAQFTIPCSAIRTLNKRTRQNVGCLHLE